MANRRSKFDNTVCVIVCVFEKKREGGEEKWEEKGELKSRCFFFFSNEQSTMHSLARSLQLLYAALRRFLISLKLVM